MKNKNLSSRADHTSKKIAKAIRIVFELCAKDFQQLAQKGNCQVTYANKKLNTQLVIAKSNDGQPRCFANYVDKDGATHLDVVHPVKSDKDTSYFKYERA